MPLTPEDVSNKRFTPVRLREGYDMGEVDAFLDEVESTLARLLQENEDLRSQAGLARSAPSAPVKDIEVAREEPSVVEPELPSTPERSPEPEKVPEEVPEPQEAPEPEVPAQPVVREPVPLPSEQIRVTTAAEASSAATRLLELATRNADELVVGAQEEAEEILAGARTQAEQVDTEARTRAQQLDEETETRRRDLIGTIEDERTRLDGEVESLRTFEREYRSRLKTYFNEQLAALDGPSEGAKAPSGDLT